MKNMNVYNTQCFVGAPFACMTVAMWRSMALNSL